MAAELEQIWEDLSQGIVECFQQTGVSNRRYMELYNHVYKYCTDRNQYAPTEGAHSSGRRGQIPSGITFSHNQSTNSIPGTNSSRGNVLGQNLYARVKDFLESYVTNLTHEREAVVGEPLLSSYLRQWEAFRFSARVLHGVFAYLNRHWVKREHDVGHLNVREIFQLAVVTWKQIFFEAVYQQLTNEMLTLIEKERNGQFVNTGLIRPVVESYVELGVDDPHEMGVTLGLATYQSHFEVQFLEATEIFYIIEVTGLLEHCPVTEYMKKALERFREEQFRGTTALHASTRPKLTRTLDLVLIQTHLETLQEEFKNLLRQDLEEDMIRMYRLVARLSDGLGPMRESLEAHITSQGLEAIKGLGNIANEPTKYVTTILGIYTKFESLVTNAFNGDTGFLASLDKACEQFINNNSVTDEAGRQKSPELVARYCNLLLRKAEKNLEEAELQEKLKKVMIVFKYLEDKDVFQKFYAKMLATRLVTDSSASNEAELNMLGKLKEVSGFEYTMKLQRMHQDVTLSKDMNEEFKRELATSEILLPIDFSIKVLTTGSWPFTQSPEFTLPTLLESSVSNFTEYYKRKHSGRKLTWLFNRSDGELLSTCFPRRYTFLCSTFQMAILLMYNNQDAYKIQTLMEATKLKLDMISQVLQTMCRVNLLHCENPDEMTEGSEVSLVKDYSNRRLRVFINFPLKMEARQEQEETHAIIDDERKYLIRASAVRIMKMRKILNHQLLMSEILEQLSSRFAPRVQIIKKCIDTLIDEGYLERDAADRNIYKYIA